MSDRLSRTKDDRLNAAVGARLRAARLSAGLTCRQAGERLGVSHAAVSHWERGVCCVGTAPLLKFARLYGTDPNTLLGWKP